MCGIAGILQTPNAYRAANAAVIGRMTARLRHRGPDADGFWFDQEAGVALGHRRLAIVDLTDAGAQPMVSNSGRFVITFNGEIYNHALLRDELRGSGHIFKGGSDTEVLLAMIEKWGLGTALTRSNGMFAIGLWDRHRRTLHLARDRMGKKPLYLAVTRTAAVFASELKAIAAYPDFFPEVNSNGVAEFLVQGWLSDEQCIWRNVFKVPPASILSLTANDLSQNPDPAALRRKSHRWWSLTDVAKNGREALTGAGDDELVSHLDGLLRRAVQERMVADVPIGLFLSGGIDSSTVVAMMQSQSAQPVRTFTIGFAESTYDESGSAAAIARYLGTDHTELRLTPAEARAVIPELPSIWDEPFADESQIPTLLLSRLARRDVTVALSGDGGDECFGGYSRHVLTSRLAPLLNSNAAIRRTAAAGIRLLARGLRADRASLLPLPDYARRMIQGDRINRLAQMMNGSSAEQMYRQTMRLSELQLTPERADDCARNLPAMRDLLSEFILRDMTGYLPGDILTKLDRASMAASLEARSPILDHHIVEFAWKLPNSAKVRHRQGKWILRQVLDRYVPRQLIDRPKQGFDVPIGAWLRGPLRSWASDLLSDARLRRQGLLNANVVQGIWRDHLNGRRDHARPLWAVLMLQSWLDTMVEPRASRTADRLEPIQ